MRHQSELGALGGHSLEHQQLALGTAVAIFVVVVVLLVHLYYKSRDGAELEDAEALLREEDVL